MGGHLLGGLQPAAVLEVGRVPVARKVWQLAPLEADVLGN
jgi:hypothetical protein